MTIKKTISKYCFKKRWTIGFIDNTIEDVINDKPIMIHYIKHRFKDRWFADPFILDYNSDYIFVLVEEYLYSIERGQIALLTINRNNYELMKSEPIIELPTHLSFPAILRQKDKLYIYPENAQGEGLGLYNYDKEKRVCNYIKNISPKPMADAIITEVFGERLLFCTHVPNHNGNTLHIYRVNNDDLSSCGNYIFDSNIARNAGDWFKVSGRVYRPAQDCNETYGGAVILQEVKRDNRGYSFINIRRLTSNHPQYTLGFHTFNYYQGLTVVDVHGWCHNYIAKLALRILNYMK